MKWIKISDRLPEYDQSILIYDGYIQRGCYCKNLGFINDEVFKITEATHWMYLPEEPNESNTAENYPVCNVCCLPIDPKRGHPSWCGK